MKCGYRGRRKWKENSLSLKEEGLRKFSLLALWKGYWSNCAEKA